MSKGPIWNPRYRTAVFPTVVEEGLAVKLGTGENEYVVVSAVGDDVAGFVQLKATVAKGGGTIFEEGGDAYATSGAAIAKGDRLTINASGKVVKIGTTAGTYHCLGVALDTVGAADNTVRFRFTKFSVTVT